MRHHHRGQAMSRLLVFVSIKKKKRRFLNTTLTIIYQHHFVFVPNNQILCLWNHSKGNKQFQFTIRKKERKQVVELSGYWMGNANGVFLFCIFINWTNRVHTCTLAPSHACTQSTTPHMHAHTHSHTHTDRCVHSPFWCLLHADKWKLVFTRRCLTGVSL